MRYASGKTRVAFQIAQHIRERERERERDEIDLTLISLFCGGLSVETKLAPYFKRVICNDKQEYLISLYQALLDGWIPPDLISEEEYQYVKAHKDEDKALTAFVGFGCSFGGKWFGGYGRHGTKDKHAAERSMCEESKRALLRDMAILKPNTEFTCLDYKDVVLPDDCVVYADPPYKNKMAAFGLKERFDIDEFWQWVRDHKEYSIYVSELEAPADFTCIWKKPVLRQLANCNAENFVATEKLFIYKGGTI